MARLYDIVILGEPSTQQVHDLKSGFEVAAVPFGLTLGAEIGWEVTPTHPQFDEQRAAIVLFFGAANPNSANLPLALDLGVPVLPIVATAAKVHDDLPEVLWHLNALDYGAGGAERVVAAALETLGLLPRQRRVFLSYRRNEARAAALQLFDALSSRVYDVFLDTHGVPPGDDFQSVLWHRLCDSDVLVMLDTATYFESRWTVTEFGRALAKGIPILRLGWPGSTPSDRTATCSHMNVDPGELDAGTGRLTASVLEAVCTRVERLRSRSHAIRRLNMVSSVRAALHQIGGTLKAVGASGVVSGVLPTGSPVSIYPTLGVPTSETLHHAERLGKGHVAVVYDPVGLQPAWLDHLNWLGSYVHSAHWVKVSEAAWDLAGWSA